MHHALVAEQGHALLAARHQQGVQRQSRAQGLRLGGQLALGSPAAGHLAEFAAVRRQQRGAGVFAVVVALGVDQHRLAGLARQLDHLADVSQAAFAVVGQNHHIMTAQDLLILFQLARQDLMAGRVLEIKTDQLLLPCHHAQLDGGGDARIALQRGGNAVRRQQTLQRGGGFVVAHYG